MAYLKFGCTLWTYGILILFVIIGSWMIFDIFGHYTEYQDDDRSLRSTYTPIILWCAKNEDQQHLVEFDKITKDLEFVKAKIKSKEIPDIPSQLTMSQIVTTTLSTIKDDTSTVVDNTDSGIKSICSEARMWKERSKSQLIMAANSRMAQHWTICGNTCQLIIASVIFPSNVIGSVIIILVMAVFIILFSSFSCCRACKQLKHTLEDNAAKLNRAFTEHGITLNDGSEEDHKALIKGQSVLNNNSNNNNNNKKRTSSPMLPSLSSINYPIVFGTNDDNDDSYNNWGKSHLA